MAQRLYTPQVFPVRPPSTTPSLVEALPSTGREARLEALGAYLRALPWTPNDQWELCTCIMHDLNSLIEARQQSEAQSY
jgi:hypothetical protein